MISKSNTGVLASIYVALGTILIVAILLIAGRHSAHAATGTTDPVTGQVNQVAIDVNTTGNAPGTGGTALLGPIDSTLANVPLNSTVMVDVVVDEIAPTDGNITGFGFNLHYDSSIVSINGHNSAFMVAPGGFEPGVVNDPDSSGNWRVDFLALTGSHVGEGILVEIGIQCGPTIGSSTLILGDDPPLGDGVPDIFAHDNTNGDPTTPMPVNNWTGKPDGLPAAQIFCGEGAGTPPATTAPATTAPATTAPATTAPATTVPGQTTAPATTAPATTVPGQTTAPATTAPASVTPTATPTHTATAPATTAAHTLTPTPTPTPSVGGATTAAHTGSGTPTPKSLPKTGGPGGDDNSMTAILLMLALGSALMLAASGSVLFVRTSHRE